MFFNTWLGHTARGYGLSICRVERFPRAHWADALRLSKRPPSWEVR